METIAVAHRNWVLIGVLVSILLHGLVFDWMRGSVQGQGGGPRLQVVLRQNGQIRASPPGISQERADGAPSILSAPIHEDEPVGRTHPARSSAQPSSVAIVAEPQSKVSAPSSNSEDAGWRPLSEEEWQALARIRIAQAWTMQGTLLHAPLLIRVMRDDDARISIQVLASGEEANETLRMLDALAQKLNTDHSILPVMASLPLDLEILP